MHGIDLPKVPAGSSSALLTPNAAGANRPIHGCGEEETLTTSERTLLALAGRSASYWTLRASQGTLESGRFHSPSSRGRGAYVGSTRARWARSFSGPSGTHFSPSLPCWDWVKACAAWNGVASAWRMSTFRGGGCWCGARDEVAQN